MSPCPRHADCDGRCDIHEDGDNRGLHRCDRCRRYAFLVGCALRTDAEDAEVHATHAWLVGLGCDPGWEIAPLEDAVVVAGKVVRRRRA